MRLLIGLCSTMNFFAGLTCFCLALVCVAGDPLPVEKTETDLRHALFEHYDHLVRPVKHVKEAISVEASLVPVGIRSVDEKHQSVKLDTWLYLRWEDDFLHWDPSEYGGLEDLRLPCTEVWTPDFAIYYSIGDSHALPSVHTNVVIHHNGTVLWVPPFTVNSHCVPPAHEEDKEHFHCAIQAGSWTYDVTLLNLHESSGDILKLSHEAFQDTNTEWALESMTSTTENKHFSCCAEDYPVIKLQLVLKKKHDDHHDEHKAEGHKDDHHDEHKDGHKDDHHDEHKDDHHDDHKDDHHDDHKEEHKDEHHDEHKDDHHDEDNHVTPAGEHH